LPEASDQDLVEAAKNGEREAYGHLVRRYMQRAYYAALFLLGNEEDARDLSQDAFARAYRNLSRFDCTRPFYPWFYRILRNLCINRLRSRSRRGISLPIDTEPGEPGVDLVDPGYDPSVLAEQSETLERFWREVSRLRPKLREIIILRHVEDLSYREIAETLEIPIGTVMSRLNAARKQLRDSLEDLFED
jgi:RNA polymerase sigma-70 factor (ECF subfamily)